MLRECVRVERCTVALMLMEGVGRSERVVERHEPIAQHLRHNRGAADNVAALITADDGLARDRNRWRNRAIHHHHIWSAGQIFDRLAHREQRGLQNIQAIDRFRTDNAESDIGMLEDDVERARALEGC